MAKQRTTKAVSIPQKSFEDLESMANLLRITPGALAEEMVAQWNDKTGGDLWAAHQAACEILNPKPKAEKAAAATELEDGRYPNSTA